MSAPSLSADIRESVATDLVQMIDVERVFVGKTNVRRNPGDVTELLQSIQAKGILEPVLARPIGDRFELVVGSRRLKAAKAVGMKKIPAVIRELTDEEAIIVSLIENVQRNDLNPEEEYDALMNLRKLNPKFYSGTEQLAKAIGKSKKYVEQHLKAIETIRSLRKEEKVDLVVKQAPTPTERKEGVLPIKHATFLQKAEEATSVQKLPSEKRKEKLTELAHTIAELPQPEAEKVVDHFVMAPRKPMEEIKKEATSLHSVKFQLLLDPRVAEALKKAAEDRRTTMEAVASLAIHSWLRQQRYT